MSYYGKYSPHSPCPLPIVNTAMVNRTWNRSSPTKTITNYALQLRSNSIGLMNYLKRNNNIQFTFRAILHDRTSIIFDHDPELLGYVLIQSSVPSLHGIVIHWSKIPPLKYDGISVVTNRFTRVDTVINISVFTEPGNFFAYSCQIELSNKRAPSL